MLWYVLLVRRRRRRRERFNSRFNSAIRTSAYGRAVVGVEGEEEEEEAEDENGLVLEDVGDSQPAGSFSPSLAGPSLLRPC